MADDKSQDKVASSPGEEAKKIERVTENTAQTDSGDKKTEDASIAEADSTASQSKPTRHLPTHYRGMPKQWEKNQGAPAALSLVDWNMSPSKMTHLSGPSDRLMKISFDDDETLPISHNLRNALDDLRQPDEAPVLCADAICMNQSKEESNKAELENQVRLMRRVITSATRVCAWIDHEVGPDNGAFDDLHHRVDIDTHEPSYWYPVADIIRNPYWQRL
ncbi:hypothetical protein GGR54DRAFT_641448 [Hypoxylon sp. NC1633]|nr:hypothetical protein GGR54DRAFT_641448 [Hypoxylon sp. NC1633]